MNIEEIIALINTEIGDGTVINIDENTSPKTLVIPNDTVSPICKLLRDNEKTYFDLLSCLTAIDNGPEINTMEVIYNLYSIPLEHSLMLKTIVSRGKPQVETVSHLWKTADWHEREAFDLFGIIFNNHPDLRRILMPADWIGHPMLKDYEEPDTYRGMKTIREEDNPI